MPRRLILAIAVVTSAQFLGSVQAFPLPSWQQIEFTASTGGKLGNPNWMQPTPAERLVVDGNKVGVTPNSTGVAVCQTFPGTADSQKFRFTTYSGGPIATAEYASAIFGYRDVNDYYEARLGVRTATSGQFYRLFFYHVVNCTANLAAFRSFPSDIDALCMETSLVGTTASISIQPINRQTGMAVGSALEYSYNGIPTEHTQGKVGLAGTGPVRFENFQGYVLSSLPEPAGIAMMMLSLLLYPRRGRR